MFSLDNSDIERFDLARAKAFVQCWSRFYDYRVKAFNGTTVIDYFKELNPAGKLTRTNLIQLLRWKDPHRLTERVMKGPKAGRGNAKVAQALGILTALNQFRAEAIGEAGVRAAISPVFRTGVVFHAFLLHVAKPHVYPIADQHVFRTYSLHRGVTIDDDWATYTGYRAYFSEIATALGVTQTLTRVAEMKRIDNALMAFGQFLKKYRRP